MFPARRTAWHTYLDLTTSLLPAVRSLPKGDANLARSFAAFNERLRANAPLWRHRGPRLLVVVTRAWLMHQAGDVTGAQVLLRIAARWLFELSRGSTPIRRSLPSGE